MERIKVKLAIQELALIIVGLPFFNKSNYNSNIFPIGYFISSFKLNPNFLSKTNMMIHWIQIGNLSTVDYEYL